MKAVSSDLLTRMNVTVPRYTSYPPANKWEGIDTQCFSKALSLLEGPLSLYIHIPFCRSLCLYCGCSVVLNRRPEKEESYFQALMKEISLIRAAIRRPLLVKEIHFGGGSPTTFSMDKLQHLLQAISYHFAATTEREVAIEVDPRGMNLMRWEELRRIGFNRVSLGVQDLDKNVQEAIRRRQSEEESLEAFFQAKRVGFQSINFDLIYGLPKQSVASFKKTIEKIVEVRPDRISLFSFAYLPHVKPHQKAIPFEWLPSTEEKFHIYLGARKWLIEGGYLPIGMDHFALPHDPLGRSLLSGTLRRNFQGYTVSGSNQVIGLGMTSISDLSTGFFQNDKDFSGYIKDIDAGRLATKTGKELSFDDQVRRWVIEELMCQFKVEKQAFKEKWKVAFDCYFHEELQNLSPWIQEGLVFADEHFIKAQGEGKFFIRNVASLFDAYYSKEEKGASRGI
jgi:oxygen-independent coproporphyrinogen III oxidase